MRIGRLLIASNMRGGDNMGGRMIREKLKSVKTLTTQCFRLYWLGALVPPFRMHHTE